MATGDGQRRGCKHREGAGGGRGQLARQQPARGSTAISTGTHSARTQPTARAALPTQHSVPQNPACQRLAAPLESALKKRGPSVVTTLAVPTWPNPEAHSVLASPPHLLEAPSVLPVQHSSWLTLPSGFALLLLTTPADHPEPTPQPSPPPTDAQTSALALALVPDPLLGSRFCLLQPMSQMPAARSFLESWVPAPVSWTTHVWSG